METNLGRVGDVEMNVVLAKTFNLLLLSPFISKGQRHDHLSLAMQSNIILSTQQAVMQQKKSEWSYLK